MESEGLNALTQTWQFRSPPPDCTTVAEKDVVL